MFDDQLHFFARVDPPQSGQSPVLCWPPFAFASKNGGLICHNHTDKDITLGDPDDVVQESQAKQLFLPARQRRVVHFRSTVVPGTHHRLTLPNRKPGESRDGTGGRNNGDDDPEVIIT
jgi:hypothetical protein